MTLGFVEPATATIPPILVRYMRSLEKRIKALEDRAVIRKSKPRSDGNLGPHIEILEDVQRILAGRVIRIGTLTVDGINLRLVGPTGNARPTYREWQIVIALLRAGQNYQTCHSLAQTIYGWDCSHTITVHMSRVRKKFATIGCEDELERNGGQYFNYRLRNLAKPVDLPESRLKTEWEDE